MEFEKYIVLLTEPEKVLRSDTGWSQEHLVFPYTSWAALWATCSIGDTIRNMLMDVRMERSFSYSLYQKQSTREGSLSLKAVAHGDSLDDAMGECFMEISHVYSFSLLWRRKQPPLGFSFLLGQHLQFKGGFQLYAHVYGPKTNVETKYASF